MVKEQILPDHNQVLPTRVQAQAQAQKQESLDPAKVPVLHQVQPAHQALILRQPQTNLAPQTQEIQQVQALRNLAFRQSPALQNQALSNLVPLQVPIRKVQAQHLLALDPVQAQGRLRLGWVQALVQAQVLARTPNLRELVRLACYLILGLPAQVLRAPSRLHLAQAQARLRPGLLTRLPALGRGQDHPNQVHQAQAQAQAHQDHLGLSLGQALLARLRALGRDQVNLGQVQDPLSRAHQAQLRARPLALGPRLLFPQVQDSIHLFLLFLAI